MPAFTSGADSAGLLSISADGPIRTARGPYRVIAIVVAIMMTVGGIALVPVSAGAQSETTEATDDLNLRSAPALNAEILDVIPAGAPVEITGDPENGFYSVTYNGQPGYAYGYYLTINGVGDGPVVPGGRVGEVYVADGPVNFRSGPSESDPVISVIPDGALVALTGDSANGFLSIIYSDRSGWAYGDLVLGTGEADVEIPDVDVEVPEIEIPDVEEPDVEIPDVSETPVEEEPEVPADEPAETPEPTAPESVPVGDTATGTATVVDGSLNLRTGPGADYEVASVLPDGATVELRGEAQNGFYPVSYDGLTGWASADFLQVGGDEPVVPEETETPAPEPTEPPIEEPAAPPAEEPSDPPVDGSDGYTEEEIIQIIYAAADKYGQPREDMLRVARCESNLNPNAVNASSNASGLFQFLPSTWETTPYADQDIFDPVANAEAAAWMWDNGRRNEWVCQ